MDFSILEQRVAMNVAVIITLLDILRKLRLVLEGFGSNWSLQNHDDIFAKEKKTISKENWVSNPPVMHLEKLCEV